MGKGTTDGKEAPRVPTVGTTRISLSEISVFTGVSHGLEPLRSTDTIFIVPYKRKERPWPPPFDIYSEKQKRYEIENHRRHRIYYVIELRKDVGCHPQSFRPYILKFFDPWGQMVFHMERERSCKLSCWGADIYGNDISVVLRATDELIGQVVQNFVLGMNTSFKVVGSNGTVEYLVEGRIPANYCTWPPPNYIHLHISVQKADTGEVLQGLEVIKDAAEPEAHDFGLKIPPEFDYKMRAVFLAFLMNIYVTYYEDGRLIEEDPDEQRNWNYFYPSRRGCTGWRSFLICIFILFMACIIGGMIAFVVVRSSSSS